jgi:single-stranded-DNA-specific exonuclease
MLADAAGFGNGAAARLGAIAFRVADTPLGQFLAASRGQAIHVAGHIRRDTYRGGDAVQLIIGDAAPAE